MKSKILAGLGILGISLTAFATGCGDSDSDSAGGGGGGDTTTTGTPDTGSTIQSGTVTATQASTGTMGGDGNDTFADADPLDEENGVQSILSELDPADTDVDYWTFTSPGGLTSILMDAKPDDDGFADGYMDLIIEVYDDQQNLLATNDDPFPRDTQDPHLLTVLPAGTFYLKVAEWCSTPEAAGVCGDDYFTNLESFDYAVNVFSQEIFENTAIEEVEPNNTPAEATPSEFVQAMAGQYYLNYGFGEFADTDDVEYFKFTVPSDVELTTGRLTNDLIVQPPSTLGSGSSRFTGVVDILNAGGDVIARQDWSGQTESANYREISGAPLVPGETFTIRITPGTTVTAPLPPFFIYTHNLSGSNPLEQNEAANNLIVSPEELFTDTDPDSYFIEGDLGDGDVDHFLVQTAGTYFAYTCSGERSGSGVRGLTVTVLTADDAMQLASFTETADADLFDYDQETGSEAALVFRVSKTSQATGVTGSYYRCGFHFYEEPLEP